MKPMHKVYLFFEKKESYFAVKEDKISGNCWFRYTYRNVFIME